MTDSGSKEAVGVNRKTPLVLRVFLAPGHYIVAQTTVSLGR